MEKQAIKDLLYGGICELLHDDRYFRFNYFNGYYQKTASEEGEKALLEFVHKMSSLIYRYEMESLDQRAKDLVLSSLKQQEKN